MSVKHVSKEVEWAVCSNMHTKKWNVSMLVYTTKVVSNTYIFLILDKLQFHVS